MFCYIAFPDTLAHCQPPVTYVITTFTISNYREKILFTQNF